MSVTVKPSSDERMGRRPRRSSMAYHRKIAAKPRNNYFGA
jgi:hypothetical protein